MGTKWIGSIKMSVVKRRDWVAKNMNKFNHGGVHHKSKKGYTRKSEKRNWKNEVSKESLPCH